MRDDAFLSFKTIDSIVPVVIASFEAKHPGALELQIGKAVLDIWALRFLWIFNSVQRLSSCVHRCSNACPKAPQNPVRFFFSSKLLSKLIMCKRFFNHLVGALGRDEFAVSICLLLVDKVVNKVVRKRPGEIANAFGLPLTVLQANSKAVSFEVCLLSCSFCNLLDIVMSSPSNDSYVKVPDSFTG